MTQQPLDHTIDWVYGRSPSRTLSERSSMHADSAVSRQSSITSRGAQQRRTSLECVAPKSSKPHSPRVVVTTP